MNPKGYYNKPQQYWETRWRIYPESLSKEAYQVRNAHDFKVLSLIMKKHGCNSILDVGCGEAFLRSLKGYVGMDFSIGALKRTGLKTFIYGDIADGIAVQPKSFDAVMTRFVLYHMPFDKIEKTVQNIKNIAKKLIILIEYESETPIKESEHCYRHDLAKMFEDFDGHVEIIKPEEGWRK